MTQKTSMKPLALALGAAFATTLSGASVANAADNPFAMTELSGGYMVAAAAEGKCGEGKCGGEKKAATEGKCGEGKCGMKRMDADGNGSITKEEFMQGHETMFDKLDANGDGVIDADEQHAGMKMMKQGKCGEGKCGGEKKSATEGKCGEGKCGGSN